MKPLITMIVPYYRQPKMLAKQLETWESYPQSAREFFRFVVVDDCSPEPAEDVTDTAWQESPPSARGVSLYRIDKDIEWNRSMARNLGTTVAETEWVLHVDTDHVLGADEAAKLVADNMHVVPKSTWSRFRRFRMGRADETRKKDKIPPDAAYGEIHPHIDSYLCTKEQYWKAGGYNTRFSGVLGGGTPFLKEMVRVNGEPHLLPVALDVYTRGAVSDASEHTLPRDPAAFKKRKAEIMAKYGTLRADPKEALPLPWHKVF